MTKHESGDQAALRIMLDARLTFKQRQARLAALALKLRKALNREVGCPACGDEGPHEDNGSELCCRTCGENFPCD